MKAHDAGEVGIAVDLNPAAMIFYNLPNNR
jgi:hypothetical protein